MKSIKKKYKGKTFAQAAKSVSDKYKDRDTNEISMRSFNAEMNELMRIQELYKLKENVGKSIKNVMPKQKMQVGGFIPPTTSLELYDTVKSRNISPTDQLPSLDFKAEFTPPNLSTMPPSATEQNNQIRSFEDWMKNDVMSPVTVGKGLEAIGKLTMLASGYDKAAPVYNPFESKVRQLMETRGADYGQAKQDILAEGEAAQSRLSNVRSSNIRTALSQNISGRVADQLSRVSMGQQDRQDQLKTQYASTLDALGRQRVGADVLAEQLTNQSKVGYQAGIQNMLESAGQAGQEITNYRANIAQQQLIASVLQTKDFKVGDPKGVIGKALRGNEIHYNDAVQISTAVANGLIAPEDIDKALEEAKKKHQSNLRQLNQ